MISNGTSCSAWRLYVILDPAAAGRRPLRDVAAAAIRGGADVLQLRDKTATAERLAEEAAQLLPLARQAGIPLLINDRIEVAQEVGADGVHLGQDDLPVEHARRLLGAHRLIGKSTHSLQQALAAQAEGVSYIGLGPIFPTPTKPEYGSVGPGLMTTVRRRVTVPIVAIGGIDAETLPRVVEAGARCVAVVRAVCGSPDPETATAQIRHTLIRLTARNSPRATARRHV